MTQEELDALMSGDLEDMQDDTLDEMSKQDVASDMQEEQQQDGDYPAGYSKKTAHHWPPPSTDENKMVHQLDDVTKESEEKATQIFDIVESVSNDLMQKEAVVKEIKATLDSNIELFSNLHTKFPDIKAFGVQLEKNKVAKSGADDILDTFLNDGDMLMNVMDIMQYQDIHRQKIERVINIMRALSSYLNSLFEGRIDDSKRVSSAQHIVGDTHNETVSEDDLEALLAQFAKK